MQILSRRMAKNRWQSDSINLLRVLRLERKKNQREIGISRIHIRIQIWVKAFSEIGKKIEKNKEIIAGKMTGNPRVCWDVELDPRCISAIFL